MSLFSSRILGVIVFLYLITVQTTCTCLDNQYFDTTSNQCITCNSTCSTCAFSAQNCSACIEGYYLSSSICLSCSSACVSCNSSSDCSSCFPRFYLDSNRCLPCGLHCQTCVNSSLCSVCMVGYDLSSNCLSCSNEFYLNTTYNACDLCSTGCLICLEKAVCTRCKSDYVLTRDSSCEYYGTGQYPEHNDHGDENHQLKEGSDKSVFIILGSVLGGIFLIVCIACIVYSCLKNNKSPLKGRKSRTKVIMNSVGHIDLEKELGIQLEAQICSFCETTKAEIPLKCGHFVHQGCFRKQTKCRQCSEEYSMDQTKFNQERSGKRSESSKEENQSEFFTIDKENSKQEFQENGNNDK